MASKLLLIDGNSILNRGFYGVPLLTDKNGVYTNAVFGFLSIMLKVVEDTKPNYLVVAFDVHAPTFRHKMYEAYKGTRKPMAEELKCQLPLIRKVLASMSVKMVEMAGYEADDLLGTLAKRYAAKGFDVVLLSGDRDLLQISDTNILISIPKTTKGKTETFNYFPENVKEEYGVTPLQFIEVKALQGDSSDNIPGVPKVGPKTATELIQKYDTLEGIYEHIDEIDKKALKENLSNNRELAFLCRDLARININAPIEVDIRTATLDNMLNENSLEVLREHSLKNIITKLESLNLQSEADITTSKDDRLVLEVCEDFERAVGYITGFGKCNKLGISACDSGVAFSFSKDENVFIPFGGLLNREFLQSEINKSLKDTERIYSHNIKKVYDYVGEYRKGMHDSQILCYLKDPLRSEYSATFVGEQYLDLYTVNADEYDKAVFETVLEARNALLSTDYLLEIIDSDGLMKLYEDIEMPLSFVLYSMEKEGVYVNKEELLAYGDKLSASIDVLTQEIYELSGEVFNINSPKQLGEILFGKLNLPYGKKTKSGYSTAADVLEKLAGEYDIVAKVLEYRTFTKLKSTYVDGIKDFIGNDGRIHTHFNQTITATGRISSAEPNLQNIPIRTDIGAKLRAIFYPKEGCVFVDADYSQIELRLMAHFSNDEKLIESYKANKDIHRSTASEVFHVPFDDVTDQMRRNAKAVNFGIIYGISSYGLSQGLSISVSEAKQYINEYFVKFPKVKAYMDSLVETAKEKGFCTTLYGRIRPIPEINAANFMQRSFGERVAMNAPLQGTAADIMKIAMINIFYRLKNEGYKSRMVIQVHDEVLIETAHDEVDKVCELVKYEMEKAASLKVPLIADVNFGSNWYLAK